MSGELQIGFKGENYGGERKHCWQRRLAAVLPSTNSSHVGTTKRMASHECHFFASFFISGFLCLFSFCCCFSPIFDNKKEKGDSENMDKCPLECCTSLWNGRGFSGYLLNALLLRVSMWSVMDPSSLSELSFPSWKQRHIQLFSSRNLCQLAAPLDIILDCVNSHFWSFKKIVLIFNTTS